MVKITLCSLVLLAVCIPLPAKGQLADGKPVPRLQPEYATTDQSTNSAMGRVYKLETAFFGRPYNNDSLHQRLSRLENNVFGSTSYDALNDRLDRLERTLGNNPPQLKIQNPTPAKVLPPKKNAPAKESPDKKFADMLNRAQADISLKRYHAAAEELMNAISINPSSSLAFRQLGDVLIELKDSEGAQEAYKACFDNDPFGENGKYAKAKLLSISSRTAKQNAEPKDTPQQTEYAIKTMNSQVNDYGQRMAHEGRLRAAQIRRTADLQAERIQRETNQWMMDARSGYGGGGGRYSYGGLSPGLRTRYPGGGFTRFSTREISDLGYLRSNWTRTDGRIRSDAALKEAALRASYAAESAANLKEQLARPKKKGQAGLRSLGTNLYVRYYGDETPTSTDDIVPEDPAVQLKAVPAQLKYQGARP